MQSAETYFHTTRHVESMEAGAVLSEAAHATLCDLVWGGSFWDQRPTVTSALSNQPHPSKQRGFPHSSTGKALCMKVIHVHLVDVMELA